MKSAFRTVRIKSGDVLSDSSGVSTAPSAPQAPAAAGWFPDPTWPTQLRYFDGLQWTPHIMAASRTPQLVCRWPEARTLLLCTSSVFLLVLLRSFL